MSPFLVRRVRPGSIVRLTQPLGDFVLPDQLPEQLLFLTAGSGITPVAAILRSLATRNEMPDTVLVHSAPTADDVIFGGELRAMAVQFPGLRLYERHTRAAGWSRRLTMAGLARICPDWRARLTWACGPTGMSRDAESHWRRAGIDDRLHVERFGPALSPGHGRGGRVRFIASGREVDADGDLSLLVVGERVGVLMPSGCRIGHCYSCVAPLLQGRVRDLRTGREHGDEGELIQTCVSAAAGPVAIDL